MKLKLLPLILILLSAPALQAQELLDNSFGTDGMTTVSGSLYIASAVVKDSGSILLTGYTDSDTTDFDFSFAQFNADGSPDLTFGTNGIITHDIGGVKNISYASALQSDGKLVTVGRIYNNPNPDRYSIIVIRTNADGTLDTNFGTDGAVIRTFSAGSVAALCVALDTNDNIYIGCMFEYIPSVTFRYGAVAKINTTGTSFQYLYVLPSLDSQDQSEVTGIKVQSDEKIVFTGYRKTDGQSDEDIILGRLNSDGSLDEAFGTAGLAYLEADTDTRDKAFSLHLGSDDKIIISGISIISTEEGNEHVSLISRFNANGTPDTSFSTDGKTIIPFAADASPTNATSVLQPDGRIVIGGAENDADSANFAFARCNTDGSMDDTFGTGGLASIEMEGSEKITAMAWQSGKIIACGTQTDAGDESVLWLMRLLENNLGVNAHETSKISIYPNPASQRIFLNADAAYQNYTIADGNGRTIASGIIGIGGINIENLAQGIYVLKAGTYKPVKFIKE